MDTAAHVLALSPSVTVILNAEGVVIWAGGDVEAQSGYRPDELVGSNMLDHIDVEWNPLALDSVVYAMAHSGVRRPMLFRVRRKDGSHFVAEITANSQLENPDIGGLVAYIRRWDTQYLMDQVLQHLASGDTVENVFELLVEVTAAEILDSTSAIVWDLADGRFARHVESPRLGLAVPLELSGCLADAVASKAPTWHPTEGSADPLDQAAAAAGFRWIWLWPSLIGEKVVGCIILWRRTDEEPDYTCRMALGSLVDVMRLVLERDLTSRHVQSQEVLASLGTLTAGVAHEIRHPLSFLQNFAGGATETVADLKELLGDAGALSDEVAGHIEDLTESLELMAKHAYRIETIAGNMLGYSKGRSTEAQSIDLSNLVKTFADLGYEGYRAAGHWDLTANFVVSVPDHVTADVYPEEIGRVVVNLVTTACAAAQDAARSDPERRAEVMVTMTSDDSEVRIEVHDNGVGIPEEDRQRILHPSASSQAPGEGSGGLGLEICRDIVMGLHRGDLLVQSPLGGGTTFIVILPRGSTPGARDVPEPLPDGPGDDDPVVDLSGTGP